MLVSTLHQGERVAGQRRGNIIEDVLVWAILTFPVFNCFMPIEEFIDGRSNSGPVEGAASAVKVDFYASHIVYLVTAAIIGLLLLIHWRGIVKNLWRAAPLLLFAGWVVSSTLWAFDPGFTLNSSLRFTEFLFLGIWLVYRYPFPDLVSLMVRVYATMVFGSLILMAVAPDMGTTNLTGYGDAWRAAFLHKNILGATMSLAVVVCGYAVATNMGNRILSVSTLIGALFLLVMSRSATSGIAVLVCGVVAVLCAMIQRSASPGWRVLGFSAIVAILSMGAIILMGGADLLSEVTALTQRSENLSGRKLLWYLVTAAINKNPIFGYGYGFWDGDSPAKLMIWTRLSWNAPHAHNNWLDIGIQLGFVGIGFSATLWLISFARVVRALLTGRVVGATLATLVLVNCLIRSMTETVMCAPSIASWVWFCIAFMLLASPPTNKANTELAEPESTAPNQKNPRPPYL